MQVSFLPASCSCFDTTPRELCAPIIVVEQEYGRRHLERRSFSEEPVYAF